MQPLWKTVLVFLKKLKIELPYDSAISHLGKYLGKMKTLIIREMQIKTTIRYHLIPVRTAIITKSTNNAEEGVEKREPSCTVGGNINWYNCYGEQYGVSLKNENTTV